MGARRRFSHCSPRPCRSARRRRRGAAIVEFAVVAPLFFLLIFTVLQVGRMVMVQQILTNAAREGARRGILEQTTAAEVQTIVAGYLADTSISGATVAVAPDSFSQVGRGDPVTVSVAVPFSQVSWLPVPGVFDNTILSGHCVMRGERPE
ncbi:MAG: pilus assembly protein [Planctomycetes bacterium]|nr:pilus assembly protein [Planctomycetota bacterium]